MGQRLGVAFNESDDIIKWFQGKRKEKLLKEGNDV
jgi:hypothetical protein